MVRRDPYTVARELDALVDRLALEAHCAPRFELAKDLQTALDLVRELRRAMIRRTEPMED